MRTLTMIFVLMLVAGCAGNGGAKAISGSDAVLDDAQKSYAAWTEETFASFLDQSEYCGISRSSQRHLERKWIERLGAGQSQKYYEAINQLAAIKSQAAVEPLLAIAGERKEKDNRDRWMAVRALGLIGEKSVVPELIHLVYHYNQNTRFWAQISLVRLTGVNYGTDWQQWGQWWNENEGKPAFVSERVAWTTRSEWADEKQQQASDKAFVERASMSDGGSRRSRMGSQQESTRPVETYIVTFRPTAGFDPKTPRELLDAFNKNHPPRTRTHHFRTQAVDEQLIGHICVDTTPGKDAIIAMLQECEQLELEKVVLADQGKLDILYKLRQESLKK
jgi:hypothetical protein